MGAPRSALGAPLGLLGFAVKRDSPKVLVYKVFLKVFGKLWPGSDRFHVARLGDPWESIGFTTFPSIPAGRPRRLPLACGFL